VDWWSSDWHGGLAATRAEESVVDGRRVELVAAAAPLVERVVREFAPAMPRHLDRLEMAVRGRLQLIEAVEDFDPDGAESFAEFALPRVRGAIAESLLDEGIVSLDPLDPTSTSTSPTDLGRPDAR
jgi:DNA-directed RNA polymerase specialized sigma subunit